MSNVLERIVDVTRDEVRRRRKEVPLADLESRLGPHREGRPFAEALVRPGVSIIAEHKRRSPSAGEIRAGATVTEIAQAYERGGAAALSVLTEGPHFGGTLADLEEARGAAALPILRKDFIVDGYQVYESAVAGADAILLIVAALEPKDLAALHAEAVGPRPRRARRGPRRGGAGDRAGGHRRRRHRHQQPQPRRLHGRRRAHLRAARATCRRARRSCRSPGFHTREQIEELERVGVDAVLIGETLMRAPDPEIALRDLSGHGEGAEDAL